MPWPVSLTISFAYQPGANPWDAGTRAPADFLMVQRDLKDAPALSHRMGRVGAQIHQDLVDLGRIGDNDRRPGLDRFPDLDRGRDGGSQQLDPFLDDRVELDGLLFRLLHAAEGEDLSHQVFCPLAGHQ